MRKFWIPTALAGLIYLTACVPSTTDTGNPTGTTTNDTTNTTDDTNTGGNNNGSGAASLSIRGTLLPPASTKRAPRSADSNSDPTYSVIAQSTDTLEIYRAATDEQGDFSLELPDSETGNTFMVAIMDENGQPVSTVVFDEAGDTGYTGLTMSDAASLGTIELPDDPAAAAVMPGPGATTDGMVSGNVLARLSNDGVPVGVGNNGKGQAAQGSSFANGDQILDGDEDGLPDFMDADNDGNGIVDDFDSGNGDAAPNDGVRLNFFMNLKIDESVSDVFYSGDAAAIDLALQEQTIITMEVLEESGAPKHISAVRLLESPGPSYITSMTTGVGSDPSTVWSSIGYTFEHANDRFQRFIVPHARLNAGDTFTVEVTFDDASTKQYSRMVNFVFTNIPRLEKWGQGGPLSLFNGGIITVDPTLDVNVKFFPPTDDTGAYLTGLDYSFEVFYNDINGQINNIDVAATWTTPPNGFSGSRTVFTVPAADLTLDSDNTFTVALPSSIFVDTVQTSSGSVAVHDYKIDVAPQSSGNNSAIMLHFEQH